MEKEVQAKKGGKLKWFLIGVVIIGIAGAFGSENEKGNSSGSDQSASTTEAAPEVVHKIGSTVETDYFKYKVVSVDSVSSLGEYNEPAGAGSTYLRIKIQAENIDTEGRSLSSGTLYGIMNGKEYVFDTSEIVLSDGYLVWDSINPLVTITGYVVFKVSDKFKIEDMSYEPSRSDVRIKLVK